MLKLFFRTSIALIAILVVLWLSKHVLVNHIIQRNLEDMPVNLTCLDWQVLSFNTVLIEQGCTSVDVGTHLIDIRLHQAHYNWQESKIEVAKVDVYITQLNEPYVIIASSPSDKSVNFSLPDWLPEVSINHLNFHAPGNAKPLTIGIKQQSDTFTLSQDIQGDVSLSAKQIAGDITWKTEQIAQLFNLDIPITGQVSSQFKVNSQQISATNKVDLQAVEQDALCVKDTSATGTIQLKMDMPTNTLWFDGNDIHVSGLAEQCEYVKSASIALGLPIPTHFQGQFKGHIDVTQQTLNLDNLKVSETGNEVNTLEITQGIFDENVQGELTFQANYQSKDNLKISTEGILLNDTSGWHLEVPEYQMSVEHVSHKDIALNKLSSDGSLSYYSASGLKFNGNVASQSTQYQSYQAKNFSSNVSGSLSTQGTLSIELLHTLSFAGTEEIGLADVTGNYHIGSSDLVTWQIKGETNIDRLGYDVYKFPAITIDHAGAVRQGSTLLEHIISNDNGLAINLEQNQNNLSYTLPEQHVFGLQEIVHAVAPALDLTDGTFSANGEFDIDQQSVAGSLSLNYIDGIYEGYEAHNLTYKTEFKLDSANFHIQPSNLNIERIFTGMDITNFQAQLQAIDQQLVLTDSKGELLGGTFSVTDTVFSPAEQNIEVSFSQLDLALLLALEKQTGIDVEGSLEGYLPFKLSGRQFEIIDGTVSGGQDGKILITDNAAFDALKVQQPELSTTLSLLENLDINSLTSKVNMQQDGWLVLDMQIKGTNSEQNEDVIFNFTHEQNILVLLKALRIGNEISEKILNEL